MRRAFGRSVTTMLVFALLIGTAWTGRASVARVDVDPALHAGDVALIQVAAGTAWTVAADLTSAGATDGAVLRATTDARVAAVGGGKNGKDLDRVGSQSTKDSIGIAAINVADAWPVTTGAGVVVALMDSGIAAHPDLPSGKVIARVDLANDGAAGLDPAGHGTHL